MKELIDSILTWNMIVVFFTIFPMCIICIIQENGVFLGYEFPLSIIELCYYLTFGYIVVYIPISFITIFIWMLFGGFKK